MSALADVVAGVARDYELRLAHEEQRQVELTEAEQWARDPLGWLNSGHVWIASKFADDTGRVRRVRLQTWPSQEATLAAWIDLTTLAQTGDPAFSNTAIEKSRQIGETWIFAAIIAWLLHYHNTLGGVMHQRETEVADPGWTWKSILGKVRYIDQHLDRRKVAGLGELAFSAKPPAIRNLARGSSVQGECQRDDPFRGQTLDWLLVDEAAFVQHGEKVYAALDEACPNGKALLSTVNGDGNFHARICDEKPAGWTYLRLHWSQHPAYSKGLHVAGEDTACVLCAGNRAGLRWTANQPVCHRYPGRPTSPWYDERVIGKTDEQVANELDIDRARALAGRVYPEFTDDLHLVHDGIDYVEDLGLELGWDFGLDVAAVVVCQDAPHDYRVIGLLEMGDLFGSAATPENISVELIEYLADLGVRRELLTESWRRRTIRSVSDPSGHDRSTDTGRPIVQAYRRLGWDIEKPPRLYTRSVATGITSVKRLLQGVPKPLRVCGLNASTFAERMRNHTWPTDATGRRRPGSGRTLEDIHQHTCDAFRYLIVAKWPPPESGEDESRTVTPDDLDDADARTPTRGHPRRRVPGRGESALGEGVTYGMTL